MKKKIEIEVKIPEGYEEAGEYRVPKMGEPFCDLHGRLYLQNGHYRCEYIILRKIEPYQPEYISFEIDWSGRYPYLTEKGGMRPEALIGLKIDNYRIFCFGDLEEYNPYSSYEVSTHFKGNYKYAYGRLEK